MKNMSQVKLDAIVDSHRRKLIVGAMIIQIISVIMLVVCIVGLFIDQIHCEAYCIIFCFFSFTGWFGISQYDKHKRDFK
jgi:hypothetical protein